jgi:hypothetical protein
MFQPVLYLKKDVAWTWCTVQYIYVYTYVCIAGQTIVKSRVGKVTLTSNGNEALSDESLLKSNGDEALNDDFS